MQRAATVPAGERFGIWLLGEAERAKEKRKSDEKNALAWAVAVREGDEGGRRKKIGDGFRGKRMLYSNAWLPE